MPAYGVGDETAQGWANEGTEAEDYSDHALVFAALCRSEEVADDCQRDGKQRACAQSLDAPEQDELPHALAEAGKGRADEEQGNACHQNGPPSVEIGELAVKRHRNRAAEQVDGHYPGVEGVSSQVRDDAGQRGADDGLV